MQPFTRAEAKSRGITKRQLEGPGYRRLFRGVYIAADSGLRLNTWVEAARLVLPPDARVTGVTALRLKGLDIGDDFPLFFRSSHPNLVRRSGIIVAHEPRVRPGTDSAQQAFAFLAERESLLFAVQVGDRLIHRRLARLDELNTVGRAGPHLRVGSESPKESQLRLMLTLAGLPEPALNVTLGDGAGPVARVDMLYREYRLVIEYEGRQHADDYRQWNRDIERCEGLQTLGYTVLRVTQERLYRPIELVCLIDSHLRERGYRGPKPTFDAGWRAEFGARASAAA